MMLVKLKLVQGTLFNIKEKMNNQTMLLMKNMNNQTMLLMKNMNNQTMLLMKNMNNQVVPLMKRMSNQNWLLATIDTIQVNIFMDFGMM